MNQPLKIVHTSDVHLLDGDEGALARDAFAGVVEAVVDTNPELFLIAGDLFDHNRVQRETIEFVYEELSRVRCATVIIAGNHDCWEERSVLQRMNFRHAGHHVTLLDQEHGSVVEFPELHATVWGRCMIEHVPDNKPMAGSPARKADMWHIGMAHGLYSDEPDPGRSSLITPQEIEASGFDYLALGHVHVHRQMRHGHTLACYPGVPAAHLGTSPHGCYASVTLTPGKGVRVVQQTVQARTSRRRQSAGTAHHGR